MMKMHRYNLVFHPDADADFDDAYSWYLDIESSLAERFAKQTLKKLQDIANTPETYGEKSKRGFREVSLPDFPYSIVYKIQPRQKVVFISSIHHHKQHPKKKFRK